MWLRKILKTPFMFLNICKRCAVNHSNSSSCRFFSSIFPTSPKSARARGSGRSFRDPPPSPTFPPAYRSKPLTSSNLMHRVETSTHCSYTRIHVVSHTPVISLHLGKRVISLSMIDTFTLLPLMCIHCQYYIRLQVSFIKRPLTLQTSTHCVVKIMHPIYWKLFSV